MPLSSLQVLQLENNRLDVLPENIGELPNIVKVGCAWQGSGAALHLRELTKHMHVQPMHSASAGCELG